MCHLFCFSNFVFEKISLFLRFIIVNLITKNYFFCINWSNCCKIIMMMRKLNEVFAKNASFFATFQICWRVINVNDFAAKRIFDIRILNIFWTVKNIFNYCSKITICFVSEIAQFSALKTLLFVKIWSKIEFTAI